MGVVVGQGERSHRKDGYCGDWKIRGTGASPVFWFVFLFLCVPLLVKKSMGEAPMPRSQSCLTGALLLRFYSRTAKSG
jgi:hypothetical protein